MLFRIVAVGRLRERYWLDGCSEYVRRLSAYAKIEVVEVPESRPGGSGTADESRSMKKEGDRILARMRAGNGAVSVALDRQGTPMDSLELAAWIESRILEGNKEITWIIGGPSGLSPEVLERVDLQLSFSKLTFPHQMIRLILLEQIYRSFRIMKSEPYHR